jgi:catechol 2,3-dioxygenase-like lactoylglutathione lyase family enzyme
MAATPLWPVAGSDVVFYYRDLDAAVEFYTRKLGFKITMDGRLTDGIGVHVQLASTSHITLVDGSSPRSNKTGNEPKATAIALLTNDLDAWDAHAAAEGLAFRNGKRLQREAPGAAHDGFVVLDPEGYLLEFEQFLPHAENAKLLPLLATLPPVVADLPGPPKALVGTVNWLYYREPADARRWHEGVLRMPLVCEQPGVACIYQTSASGFFGAVDERSGMCDWAAPAAVMVSFITTRLETDFARWLAPALRDAPAAVDTSDERFAAAVGYDVGGYAYEVRAPARLLLSTRCADPATLWPHTCAVLSNSCQQRSNEGLRCGAEGTKAVPLAS